MRLCGDFLPAAFGSGLRHRIELGRPIAQKLSENLGLDEEEARRTISKVDKARENYHVNYAGYKPDDKRFKDIMIDSSFLGIDGTAQYLAEAVKRKFGK